MLPTKINMPGKNVFSGLSLILSGSFGILHMGDWKI